MICFYHRGDLDGHCAGAIVRHCFPNALMVGIDYEDPFPWGLPQIQEDGEGIFMVDFSLPMEEMQRLYHFSQRFVWIDHHKTAIDKAKEAGFDTPGLRVVGKAACELTWEYFFSGKTMPWAVFLLGRYDVWDEGQPNWQHGILPFQYGMRGHITNPDNPESKKLWDSLLQTASDAGILLPTGVKINGICDVGRYILRYQELENAKLMTRQAFITFFEGMYCRAVNHGPGSSMKFEAHPNYQDSPVLISFARLPQQKWLVNLYTFREDVDCGEIAKKYGGGGHRRAAGFICEGELPFQI